jgi:hypothetical protein
VSRICPSHFTRPTKRGIDKFYPDAILKLMSDTLASTANASDTAKKQQSLLHVGSQNRDALEAIGTTYDPPMRWQDLARQVLKNFIAGSQHDAALKRAQLRLLETGADAK